MTYTQFEYANLKLEKTEVDIAQEIRLSVDLKNTGDTAGCEVVQLYVHDKLASLVRPIRELKGFQRVELEPGESATVYFTLPVDMLNFTDNQQQRIVEPGEFELMIGKSSTDIPLSTVVTVTGETRVLPKRWNMVCHAEVSRP